MKRKRRILFVDNDPKHLESYTRMLTATADHWEVIGVGSCAEARTLMSTNACDVVLVEQVLRDGDADEFLKEIHTNFPKATRFLLAESTDTQILARHSAGAHQCLTTPCDAETLKAAISNAIGCASWLTNEKLKAAVARMRTFRSLPTLYLEAMKELNSPSASPSAVGDIIAKDLAMTAKVLQLVNSSFFGLKNRITTPADAVLTLGLDTVKAVITGIQIYADLDKVKPLYFSTDKLWRHSVAVGTRAKQLAEFVTGDRKISDDAFTAGLFHDIGKLVLAVQFEELYNRAGSLADKRKIGIWEIEQESFGATHAETGAYLLGLWGLPEEVLEATALHHFPSRSEDTAFSALTAVHVANVLEFEQRVEKQEFVAPQIDLSYLATIGLATEVDRWRELLLGDRLHQPARSSGDTVMLVRTAAKPVETRENLPVSLESWKAFLAPAFAVIALSVGLLWVSVYWGAKSPDSATLNGLTSRPGVKAIQAPRTEALVAQVAPATAELSPMEESEPVNEVASPVIAASQSKPDAFALKLQGIHYSQTRQTALINGRMVNSGDEIDGAQILAIDRRSVTINYGGQTSVLNLKK